MIYIQSFAFNPFSENTYLVYNDDKDAFLIDPGNFNEHETKILTDFIETEGIKIKNILLTHAHIDHVLGLQWAYDTYKVPVLMHETEKEILDRNPMSASRFGFFFKPFEGEINFISQDDTLNLDGEEFVIYHVPGHSPGHVAYHHKEQNILISGDVLFQGSVGRTDLYKGNFETLITSIHNKLLILDAETEVFPGHGNPTTVAFEKDYNPFLK